MTALRIEPATPPPIAPTVRARPARVWWPEEYDDAATDLAETSDPGVIAYRISDGPHRQLGVVVEISVEDYRTGGVRRHEATRPDRVHGLVEHLSATGVEDVPVTLVHRGVGPEFLLPDLESDPAGLRRTDTAGTVHEAWVRRDPVRRQALRDWLDRLGPLYIADGHHRMAAADRYADLDLARRPVYTLAAVFPSSETRILGYHRRAMLPGAWRPDDFRAMLARQPDVEAIMETTTAAVPEPGVVIGYVAGHWYRLRLRAPAHESGPRAALDVVRLDDGVLVSLLGADEMAARVTPIADDGDLAVMARECDRRGEAGFFLHPPTVDQVLAVADAGQVLPPKSTWFAPKVPGGLFRRPLNGES